MSRSRLAAVLLAGLTVAGCTTGPGPVAAPGRAATASTAPPARVELPPVVAGELSRLVLGRKDGHPDDEFTVRRIARTGTEYWVHAACSSTTPGKIVTAEVRSGKPGASDQPIVTADVPCDGTVTVAGVGEVPAEPLSLYLKGDHSDLDGGYVVVAPSTELREGQNPW